MAHEKIRGIILRLVNVKDYDRYLTILTRDFGILSVYARGIRRPKNTKAGRCQLFSFADFYLFKNKERFSLDDAETVHSFSRLQADIMRVSAASQLAAMIIDHLHEREESRDFYELFIRACYELDLEKKNPYMLTWLAQMKMMNFMGYQPVLDLPENGASAAQDLSDLYFDYRRARIIEERDGRQASEDPGRAVGRISRELRALLLYLESCPVGKTFAVRLGPALIDELGQFTLRYMAEHLDKSYDKFTAFRDFAPPAKF